MTKDKKLYGFDITTQWDKILDIHVLKLAKEHHPDWYRWRLSNNYERAVFLKGDPVLPREAIRYCWANMNLFGTDVLEVGCSTGYGSQFLPVTAHYLGLDYDPIIVNVAQEQEWGLHRHFKHANINDGLTHSWDTIIAFEVIEHLDNGLDIVKTLQQHCQRLLISVPWNEPKGFWGEHHKLHGLNESNFSDFEFAYISEAGYVSNKPHVIDDNNKCNLMLCRWDA
jgi:2-polyprenyl-3-methyl-5-hydroxy-6-metoxy-1,4-benzoquinol methylase